MAAEHTEDDGTDSEKNPWDPKALRSLVPNSLGSEGQRAAVCAIRNPDASAVQIAEKCGLASSYTVSNALRSLLVGTVDQEPGAGGKEMYELRDGARKAEQYAELTEKQAAVIDFAAEHPEFMDERSYGEVSQAIHEKAGVGVGETYVGRVLRQYDEILHRRRAQAAAEGDSEAALEDVTTDLTVREMLEAAGYDLPSENLDEMPEVEVDIPEGGQATLEDAEQAEAEFEQASEVAGEDAGSSTFLDDGWVEKHTPRPGAGNAVRLPDDAEDEDVKQNTPYWAYVNGVAQYGVFVSLTNPAYGDDVSGLVKAERLYGTKDSLERGDPMVVELDHRNTKGLSLTDWRHAHPDKMGAQEAVNGADSEAEAAEAEGTDGAQDAEDAVRTAEERVQALEQAVDTLREDAVFASEVGEFADEVDDHLADLNGDIEALETRLADVDEQVQEQLGAFRDEMKDREDRVADMLQNSVKADTQAQAEQNAQTLATLQEAVNALGEQVEQATGHGGALGRVMEDVQRLQGQDATVASYSYQRQEGTVTVHLQADLGADEQEDAEQVPECHECGAPLGDEWRDANAVAEQHGTQPAACPQCGGNPLPPVGGQQEDEP